MKKFLLRIFTIALFISTCWAQESELSVRRALEIARENNPQINQLRQQIEKKRGQWWSSWGLADPELSYFSEGIDKETNKSFTEKRWTLTQSIDFPLTTYYNLRQVGLEEASLESRLQAKCLSLKMEIKSQYAELVYAQEIVHLRREQLKIARRLQDASVTRLEAGESSELDLMKADILLAESENSLDQATRMFHQSRYNLFNLIGLDPEEQTYDLEFPDTLIYVEINIDQESVMDMLENQPEYFSISQQLESAEFGLSKAWTSLLPRIDLSYYRQNYGDGYNNYGYLIGLNIPLWFPLNQRGKIQMSLAQKRISQWQQKEMSLELKRQLELAWHSYEVSKIVIERFHNQVRTKAARLSNLTLEGYLAGEIDQLTLLEAQRTYLNSEQDYFDILKTYYLRLIELEKFLQRDLVFSQDPFNCND